MDSPIEKWNLIIGNLALKQVHTHTHTLLLPLTTLKIRPLLCSFYKDESVIIKVYAGSSSQRLRTKCYR